MLFINDFYSNNNALNVLDDWPVNSQFTLQLVQFAQAFFGNVPFATVHVCMLSKLLRIFIDEYHPCKIC